MDKKKETYLVLLTHGTWGEALIESAQMIIGTIKNIYSFSLMPEDSVNEYLLNVENILNKLPEGTIIMVDLFAGSTSTIAAALTNKYKVYPISGLDLSMLIAADELRREYEGNELVEKVIETSDDNRKNIYKLLNEN